MLGRLHVLACLVALAGCGSWAPHPWHGHISGSASSPANSVPASPKSLPSSFDRYSR